MQLFLTTATPSNSVYTDESGAPKYKVNTPFKLLQRTTGISRVVEYNIPRRRSLSPDGHEVEVEEGERFASLAHIDWHLLESSVIRFRGRELATRDFFRKVGWGWYGRHRVFTARDGREYKWILGALPEQLELNDDAQILVTRYLPKKLGLLSKARKASLEVFPQFEHMLDEIMITFVYIERLRKTKERAARSPTLLNK
ncbi:hypothetical protein B0H17DRAFT_1247280 [Mycena rosella]|uniref:DUF6593 domain-containing protein n=1 Tax=Mycena rosella TaxID=1033263 RepID=A0AAD7GPA3_MYCRO|nr:hypothetical protein B0H17DRAFT_1247280 [Mycena rosella]